MTNHYERENFLENLATTSSDTLRSLILEDKLAHWVFFGIGIKRGNRGMKSRKLLILGHGSSMSESNLS